MTPTRADVEDVARRTTGARAQRRVELAPDSRLRFLDLLLAGLVKLLPGYFGGPCAHAAAR